jgi:hypothetical protein
VKVDGKASILARLQNATGQRSVKESFLAEHVNVGW